MVSPLLDQDRLDVDGLDRLIEHILGGGVHALFALGTTGEGPSLSYGLRRELVRRTCQRVAGRVPVLVGITDSSLTESVRLAQFAADSGAQALVVAPPFYFPIDQADLLVYLRELVPQLPLPVYLYNMPSHCKVIIQPDTVRQVLDMPQVVGLKDSSARALCFGQVRQIVRERRPEFSLLIGPEELVAESMPLGAHGGVCGGANMFPRLFVDLYNACVAQDASRISELQTQVLRLASTIYAVGNSGYGNLRGIKAALSCMGICSPTLARPLHSPSADEISQIRVHVDELRDHHARRFNHVATVR